LKRIAEQLHQHGTWQSIEDTFYGFGEAEELFSQQPSIGEKTLHVQADR
jgi:hypothetical protein